MIQIQDTLKLLLWKQKKRDQMEGKSKEVQ